MSKTVLSKIGTLLLPPDNLRFLLFPRLCAEREDVDYRSESNRFGKSDAAD